MNAATLQPLARDYLKRLEKAAASLPRARRKELIGEIEAHLNEALPTDAGEADALNVLERLGEPAEIVAEAGTGQAPVARLGLNERVGILLLLVGGFLLGVGWFVGVVLLWSSRIWTLRDKLIGTLVLPGGLATSGLVVTFAAASTGSGSDSSGGGVNYFALVLIGGLLVVLPVLTSIYLSRRANRLKTAAS